MHVPSLRQLARHLNYAISSLHEAKFAGHFMELPTGGYDLQAVARGLLDNSSPRTPERRALLERIAAGSDEPQQPAQTQFSARIEAAIAASSKLSRAPEVMEAIDLLARVARAKAQAFHAIVPLVDPVGAVAIFGEALAAMLDERIKQIAEGEDEPDDVDPNEDLVTVVAAVASARG